MPNIDGMSDGTGTGEVSFRFLRPDEGRVLSEAIRVAYGDSYDVRWVYDPARSRRGWRRGPTSPASPRRPEGELLCHEGMSLAAAGDAVGHSGQAVTMPAARGQHLFTRTKRHLMDWAGERGLAGMYSEATAAHPYSQRANLELGAHETGFLLGWIPASVSNDAAGRAAAAAPVGGALLHEAERRPRARVYAPERHREIVGQTLELCELRGTLADPPAGAELPERTELHVEVDADHNLALITVHVPGRRPGGGGRRRAPPPLPPRRPRRRLPRPAAGEPGDALVADHLERLGVSYAGVFPNSRADGDVLRMQSLHRVRDQGRRHRRRLRPRPRAARLRRSPTCPDADAR